MTTVLDTIPGYDRLVEDLAKIEDRVVNGYTLADAIREGARHTNQKIGGFANAQKNEVCALSAAALAVQARYSE